MRAMLEATAALWREFDQLHREMLRIVRDDAICRRLMTPPGVGPLVAITFKSAIDNPDRIAKSKTVGALFGLVPKKYQSGRKTLAAALLEPGTISTHSAVRSGQCDAHPYDAVLELKTLGA